ncbi:MAG: hypothetical protein A2381_12395 [Bdellovibrionales bacterium RIFOXYB1_FULL_37_110]|nr:MAG: hypothetical protein A2181_05720 [Bdellovibrionales bacterium RIFOXYA1_FULL_38_20]OFZ47354.1 MAG: hypothetical protein A2417_12035 [Bdellovibrionales bacterium RIFOXYC1_FULL_37_79]OFZ58515.1 MAG: hypothetical protein A2381_12395 [Bdellovibrionales bacterium RIFOXYB1_FULL_37_110]OFZ63563.1 MAG: hypothetical protein A2577_08545 [Bdellovibrionales bacterium RIFOXYD1_FULL_36_51]
MINNSDTAVEKNPNKQPIIEFDLGKEPVDFDSDDFNFTPLTTGLGFNHERDKRVLKTGKNVNRIVESAATQKNQLKEKMFDASSYLDVFEKKLNIKKEETVQENQADVIQLAPVRIQISAWLIDVLVIFAFMSVTMIFSAVVPGMKLNDFLNLISFKDMIIFSIIMFVCYYVLYFSIMDFFITPGKYLLNIRLVRTNGANLTLKDTFIRSLVSAASFLALCVPLYIDFHGKISDTKVIMNNN